ncbi:MAG: alpha/beta hydrolase [Microbacteriaceae bacterium]
MVARKRGHWVSDVLGAGFEQQTLALDSDEEGEVVATLVRYRQRGRFAEFFQRTPLKRTDVLFVHGWSDYFFNHELAQFWHRMGANFYALDLRKYGRSLRDYQTPGFITDLKDYDEEIGAALAAIAAEHGVAQVPDPKRKLILMGHSTGGLTLSLWTNRHPGIADALVLDSPWLEFQARSFGRSAITPIVELSTRLLPREHLPNINLNFYARALSKELGGEWDYNLKWKPHNAFSTPVAWLKAILDGHAEVKEGLQIDVPVLTMISKKSTLKLQWDDEMLRSDNVIDVEVVARRALNLGNTVSIVRVPGALHNLFLSPHPVRDEAYDELRRWLTGYR